MSVSTRSLRNVALAGHGGTGKTTLVEEMLAAGGAIPKAERVETGKTVSDFTEEEIAPQDLRPHLAQPRHVEGPQGQHPRHAGIRGLRRRSHRRLPRGGLRHAGGRRRRRRADRDDQAVAAARTPGDAPVRLREQDGEGTRGFRPVRRRPHGEVQGELRARRHPARGRRRLHRRRGPRRAEGLDRRQGSRGSRRGKGRVEAARQKLVESAAEGDDSLIEKFFAEGNLTSDEIRKGLANGMKSGQALPGALRRGSHGRRRSSACWTSSPARLPPRKATAKGASPDGKEIVRKVSETEPASCFVFKTAMDQFTGKLSYFKVMSGKVAADADLVIAREGKKEKITKVYTCLGKKLEDASELVAGDLGLFTKSATLRTNDTLHAPNAPIVYPPLELPTPVHSLAITAKAKKDEDKMNQMLQRITEEDLTFHPLLRQGNQGDGHLGHGRAAHLHDPGQDPGEPEDRDGDQDPPRGLPGDHPGQGRGGVHPQEADRRPRPVRQGVPGGQPDPAGREVQVHQRHLRRRHLQGLHPRRRKGRRRGHGGRGPRRLPRGGRGSPDRGRQGAPRRLVGARLQARRPGGLPRVHAEREARPPGAGVQPHGVRGRPVPRRGAFGPERQARARCRARTRSAAASSRSRRRCPRPSSCATRST